MGQITVFVLTCKGMTQRHKMCQEGGSDLEPKDMLFFLSHSHPPCRISPKSYILHEAFSECQELACVFSPTTVPQDSPDFLSCFQPGIVEGARALKSKALDLWPDLTTK